jgi:hypothetical protein
MIEIPSSNKTFAHRADDVKQLGERKMSARINTLRKMIKVELQTSYLPGLADDAVADYIVALLTHSNVSLRSKSSLRDLLRPFFLSGRDMSKFISWLNEITDGDAGDDDPAEVEELRRQLRAYQQTLGLNTSSVQ